MPRYAAFLRGINVGGRRASGDQLRSCLEEMGFGDVATFRASGNLIFSAKGGGRDKITSRIERGLTKSLGYEVPVFLRTAAEVNAIADHNPFTARLVEASAGKLQVVLLAAKPTAKAGREMLALAGDEDKLAIRGREVYWLPSGGILDSALEMSSFGAVFGPTTMRTKNTIDQIAAKFFAA